MFSTDRYSFLKKIRFGRKSRVYRMLGQQLETDLKERKFVEVFRLERGEDVDSSRLVCTFLSNTPEANASSLSGADLGRIAKGLKLDFVPPALERRCDDSGIDPKQYVMEAFFKGKLYSQIKETSEKYDEPHFLELDFVLECTTAANNLLKTSEAQGGEPDWAKIDRRWGAIFSEIVERELRESAKDAASSGMAARGKKTSAGEEGETAVGAVAETKAGKGAAGKKAISSFSENDVGGASGKKPKKR
jgi:hypothetical protein